MKQNLLISFILACIFLETGVTCSESDAENGEFLKDSYDFIVVGGGLSGCVVARRLSEKYSVLVIEAGGDPGDTFDIPATTLDLLVNPEFTKVYPSVAQTNAGLTTNGTLHYVMGRTLGGGSSVNGMIYNRGSPFDYDNWSNITGDPSWNYSNLLKYFKRIEDYQGIFDSEEHHGKGGPIPITFSKYAPGLTPWLEAGKYLGYEASDPNGPQKIGFSTMEFSKIKGKRVSAYSGYIKPFLKTRPQLKILKHSVVTKVIFEGIKAVGVEYVGKNQQTVKIFAKKEVIISAGTMDSPAILLRSGIGPKDALHDAKITPVKILPVGQNLQDHLLLKLDFTLSKNLAASEVFIPERDLNPENLRIFEETGEGPYSSINGIHGQAFLVSSKRSNMNPQEWPDIQIALIQCPGMINIIIEESLEKNDETVGISVVVLNSRPNSSGKLTLNPDNINGPPFIDFQFLTQPDDMEVMIEGIKNALKTIEETPSFQKLGARYSKKAFASCGHHEFRSDAYWRCFVSYKAGSGVHAGGTCRMGKGADDAQAVVDSKLKVIGIEGLRVVDLSVMPNVTNANTQAPAYVIAEKASEQILMDWEGEKEESAFGGGGNARQEL